MLLKSIPCHTVAVGDGFSESYEQIIVDDIVLQQLSDLGSNVSYTVIQITMQLITWTIRAGPSAEL